MDRIIEPHRSCHPERTEGSAFYARNATNNREENVNNRAFRQGIAVDKPKKIRRIARRILKTQTSSTNQN
jgi:hypothetical protein